MREILFNFIFIHSQASQAVELTPPLLDWVQEDDISLKNLGKYLLELCFDLVDLLPETAVVIGATQGYHEDSQQRQDSTCVFCHTLLSKMI